MTDPIEPGEDAAFERAVGAAPDEEIAKELLSVIARDDQPTGHPPHGSRDVDPDA